MTNTTMRNADSPPPFHRPLRPLSTPFSGFQLPFPYQVSIVLLVLCPMLIMRRFERPKRRFAVWALDLIRLFLGYVGAEAFLVLLIIPYSGLAGKIFSPGPTDSFFPHRNWGGRNGENNNSNKGDWNGLHNNNQEFRNHQNDPSSNVNNVNQPNNYEKRTGNPSRYFASRFFYVQSTSLTLSLLEVFPGMFFIFGFYWLFLYLFYVVVIFWKKSLRSPRLVFRRRRRCLPMIVRGPKMSGLPKPNNNSGNNDRFSRQKLGFVSGFYGFPIKVSWFSQQVVCFMAAVFVTRIIIIKLCQLLPDKANSLRSNVFIWNMESGALKMFLMGVIVPALMYMVQFCVADLVLRFRSKAVIKYTHDRELQPMFRASNLFYRVYPHTDEYELQELTLPVLVTNERDEEIRSSTTTTTPTTAHQNQSSLRSHEDLRLERLEEERNGPFLSLPNGGEGSSARQSAVVTELPPSIREMPSTSSFASSRMSDHSRPQLGIVTATLLNAAAVTATATSRSEIFGFHPPTPQPPVSSVVSVLPSQPQNSQNEQISTIASFSTEPADSNNSNSTSNAASDTTAIFSSASASTTATEAEVISITGPVNGQQQHDSDEDDELYSQLPSYDDSERQQQELLRDPEQAGRHQNVINGMKR